MKHRGKFNKTAGFKLNNMTLEEKKENMRETVE